MRHAEFSSSVDRLRMRERFRFQKNNSGKKPRPAQSRETLAAMVERQHNKQKANN